MSPNLPAPTASTSLERALDQNEAIQDTVEQSAAELFVINAVLKQEVPDHVQTGEVAQALQKTDELESRIQSSADELAQVNDALKEEIIARARLERKLASTQAALGQAQAGSQSQPQDHSKGHSRGRSANQ
jgi:C4-dicarboxylate-specific signal transduction histidine kinase